MFTAEKMHDLLDRHGIHAPVSDERFLSHGDTDRGIRMRIVCAPDERWGSTIAVSCNGEDVSRTIPLTREKAAGIVDKLRRRKLVPAASAEQHTLTNLLMRCSDLYVAENLESLVLDPLYLRENDYRVGSAAMTSSHAGETHERLGPHAHDTGAVFAYRPTARLKNVNDRPKT